MTQPKQNVPLRIRNEQCSQSLLQMNVALRLKQFTVFTVLSQQSLVVRWWQFKFVSRDSETDTKREGIVSPPQLHFPVITF